MSDAKLPDMSGDTFGYLEHFRQEKYLRAGHNDAKEEYKRRLALRRRAEIGEAFLENDKREKMGMTGSTVMSEETKAKLEEEAAKLEEQISGTGAGKELQVDERYREEMRMKEREEERAKMKKKVDTKTLP